MSSYNLPCVTQSLFHIYTLCCFWLTRGTGEFFKGKAKRCFRDWPFVYFSGGFISHLFGDYANINLRKSDYMKAWNSIKNDCGRFVKNQMQRPLCLKQRISRNGQGIFRNSTHDRERWGLQILCCLSNIWCQIMPTQPNLRPTHTQSDTVCQQKGHCLPDDLCPSHLQPTQPYFQFPSRQMHKFSYQLPK